MVSFSFFGGDSLIYTILCVCLIIAVLIWQIYFGLQFHKFSTVTDDGYTACITWNLIGVMMFMVFVMKTMVQSLDCILLFGFLPLGILSSAVSCILARKKTSDMYLMGHHSQESIKSHQSAWKLQNVLTVILCCIVCICIMGLVLKIWSLNGITNIELFDVPFWRKSIIIC